MELIGGEGAGRFGCGLGDVLMEDRKESAASVG